jgi:hypothetical protein
VDSVSCGALSTVGKAVMRALAAIDMKEAAYRGGLFWIGISNDGAANRNDARDLDPIRNDDRGRRDGPEPG